PAILKAEWPGWAALAIGVLSLTCLLGWVLPLFGLVTPAGPFWEFFLYWGSLPFVLVLTVELAFTGVMYRRVHRVLASVEQRGRDLGMLARVLDRLGGAGVFSPRPGGVARGLLHGDGTGGPPVQRSAAQGNRIALAEWLRI